MESLLPIDTLYDYQKFLRNGPIATLPSTQHGAQVAIIGAGAAGLAAAYELLRIGVKPTVYEASPYIGGRCRTGYFHAETGELTGDYADLGAMRFPVSSQLLFHYLDTFGVEAKNYFPNPGQRLTLLHYQNTQEFWFPGKQPPARFSQVANKWYTLIKPIVSPIMAAAELNDTAWTKRIWQSYIDRYANDSFYRVLQQAGWSADEIARFGALGIGTGGFDSLYQVSFLEILRIVITKFEVAQMQIEGGADTLMQKFYRTPVSLMNGQSASLADLGCVKTRHVVTSLIRQGNEVHVSYQDELGKQHQKTYDAVIVATTTRAMEELMGLTTSSNILSPEVKSAIRATYLISASKLFIRTKSKFWLEDSSIPEVILTDELPRSVYGIDCGPHTSSGVVCLSYAWGDHAIKQSGLDLDQRLTVLKDTIARISPGFAHHLIPVNNEIYHIDWHAEPFYYGGFKLPHPGDDYRTQQLYYQYLSVFDHDQRGVYLAGDSVSWSGGWLEGALQTAVNASCAVAYQLGATVASDSPLMQDPALYYYS